MRALRQPLPPRQNLGSLGLLLMEVVVVVQHHHRQRQQQQEWRQAGPSPRPRSPLPQ